MDANEVLTGVEHFLIEILPKALSYRHWEEDEIRSAFLWAQFCEKVYESYKNKVLRNKLDELIHALMLQFPNLNQGLCFEDLKRSSCILYEVLATHATFDKEKIKLIYLETNAGRNNIEKLDDQQELDALCYEIIEALKPVKLINSERSLYQEVKTEIFLNLLKDSTVNMTSEEQVQRYLSDSLEKLCVGRNEIGLLLRILAHKIEKRDNSSIAEIQEFAINWAILKLLSEENTHLSQFLWKETASLRAISLNRLDFLYIYFDHLSKSAMSLFYVEDEMTWISRNPVSDLSFEDILNHFRSLLKEDDDVCEATKKYLLDLLDTQPDVPIFKEIFCRVT